ncbi:TetR family transcriptional regulator C-terminal domain-containing protein [Paracoccus sp. S1E-3]|uniref:TetR family transcriptional regulator C-terminal domain-containing protein n=1 Tax=Paracoccus sp. S1E-3 TaxID=2756130 RepID=UPI0015EF8C11|nr:TetR family transcriptional regulator C-terminal domain-containing protein [Paracoccus sp. S1E-3]MBA4489270.1 TetR family transcriptional regulator C-terminal domain-containing protein [Paracoccus sp. S1E-3]
MTDPAPQSRIRKRNTQAILAAALDVFSAQGFRGATLDQIAAAADLSKPNLLYYFPSKEAVYLALLGSLLEDWLQPLRAIDPEGDPIEEMLSYIRAKLRMSRSHARESRLFAGEVLGGADHIRSVLEGPLRDLVDEKAALIRVWMEAGRLAPSDPHHLIFSIWALTQHYADFAPQVQAVLGPGRDPVAEGQCFTETLFRRMLTP